MIGIIVLFELHNTQSEARQRPRCGQFSNNLVQLFRIVCEGRLHSVRIRFLFVRLDPHIGIWLELGNDHAVDDLHIILMLEFRNWKIIVISMKSSSMNEESY